jgi:hypothetical protein
MGVGRMNHQQQRQFYDLITASIEGDINPEQFAELRHLLGSSREALKLYVDYVSILTDIRSSKPLFDQDAECSYDSRMWEVLSEYERTAPVVNRRIGSPGTENVLIQNVEYPPYSYRVNRWAFMLLFSAAAAIFLLVFLVRFALPPAGVEVATLNDSINAKWANSAGSIEKGKRFAARSEEFCLQQGLAEIVFDNDVRVVIEGPAAFEMLTGDQINLRYGRIYATVPTHAIGFIVNTPTCRIIDLSTEFGVQADMFGDVHLHVISGKTALIAGGKSNKVNFQVAEGQAKKVFSATQTVSDIPCDEDLFVRAIDSQTRLVWRGQRSVSLADIVGGGNGFGSGVLNDGIDAATGKILRELPNDLVQLGSAGYRTVDDNPYIDGVFIPGVDEGVTRITADGSLTAEFPQTKGNYWGYIFNGAFHSGENVPRHNLIMNGMAFGRPETPAISMHSNQGMTFDLSAIRKNVPAGTMRQFRSLIGISETVQTYEQNSTAVFWVFLDGRKVVEQKMSSTDPAIQIEVPITAEDRFLTLAVTESDDTWGHDWAIFGFPELVIKPTK